jgi:Fe-S-cluster containining protein
VTSICVGCGMCCDGTMYRTVDVGQDDSIEILTSAGFVFTSRPEGRTSFLQPCCAFGAGSCAVYDSRPAVCRGYRCLLLRRYESAETTYEEAKSLISRTIALRDRVRAGLTSYVRPETSESLDKIYKLMLEKFDAEPDPAAARREQSELLFNVVALRVILAREFEPRDSSSHKPEEPPPPPSEP